MEKKSEVHLHQAAELVESESFGGIESEYHTIMRYRDLPQLWPFISYNWLFQWDYTCYKWGFLSTYNWYFGP